MSDEKTFNIEVTMNERWIDHFCSFLKRMEYDGCIGHSETIKFYSDGDGDFRPKFNITGIKFNKVDPLNKFINHYKRNGDLFPTEEVYDAG